MNPKTRIVARVVGAIAIIAAVLVIALIVYAYRTNRTLEQTLATNINVSGDWIEISAEPLLQTRRMVSEIVIAVPDYRNELGGAFEIKLPNGRIVQPQIQVVDANGTVFQLRHSGFNYTGSDALIIFTPEGGFPDGEYKTVRIRSDGTLPIERIYWRERNLK